MLFTLVWLFVLLIKLGTSDYEKFQDTSLQNRITMHNFAEHTANCLIRIAERDFGGWKYVGITSLFNMTAPTAEIQRIVIKTMHYSLRWLIEIVNDDDHNKPPIDNASIPKVPEHRDFSAKRKNYHYIFIIDTWAQFQIEVEKVCRSLSFNPSAHFLIYIHDIRTQWSSYKVFKYLWDHQMINSLLLLHQKVDASEPLNVFSLNAFNPAKICGTNITGDLIAKCKNGRTVPDVNFYNDRVPKNVQACQIRAVAMTWPPFVIDVTADVDPGIEIVVVKTLAKMFNITINFMQSEQPWGGRELNGTWTGLLSKIQTQQASIAIGNIFPDQKIYEDFFLSSPYMEACVSWFVPLAKLRPKWQNFILIFQASLWVSIISTIAAGAVTWYYLAFHTRSDIRLRDIGKCLLNGICLLFAMSNPTRPRANIMRFGFLLGGIVGIHINAFYEASLINIFTNPPHEHQIQNIDDLVKSGLKMGGVGAFRQFYNDSGEPMSDHIFNNYEEDQENATLYYYLQKVTDTKRFATMANTFYYDFYVSRGDRSVCDKQQCPAIYGFPQNVLCYSTNIVARRGFPFIYRMSRLISRFRETGILSKWIDEIQTSLKRTQGRRIKDNAYLILTVEHLQGAFGLLILGNTFAIFIFVIEFVTKASYFEFIQ